ncbi:probable crossover junction endonuclease EME2 isoform X2 [Dromiciops gliroides]|uniref:probable crossover junction endonuclease EME2 isoform X2 n=1 Tax=Dromiciops gliroides TaxID=33562 RepID=UPI001CC753B6|nr:probable crossover junction endonuclease EME2 isoform X2 [Dromiciops gliroides]
MELQSRGSPGQGCGRQPPRRRPVTWEISDSEPESPASSNAEGPGDPEEMTPSSGGLGPPAGPVAAPVRGRPREGMGRRVREERGAAAARVEARKRVRELEKQRRKEAAEALRLMRPDHCLRHLTVLLDPALLENAGSDVLLEALGSLKCEYVIESQPWVRSLTWKRSVPAICQSSAASVAPWAAEAQEVVVVLEPEEFLKGLLSLAQGHPTACSVPWIILENTEGQTHYHLAVVGLDAYQWFSQSGAKGGQQDSDGVPSSSKVVMTQQEVEEALVLLQLQKNLPVLLVHSWQELSQHMCALTKAIAQCPYKRHMETQAFSFCPVGRWAGGKCVAQDGKGLRDAWRKQIQQFNRVSPSMADAVITAFPSPSLLRHMHFVPQRRNACLCSVTLQ